MKKTTTSSITQWQDNVLPTYGTPAITLVSGKGAVLVDQNGKKYLDFLAGIATNVIGHAHPAVVKAVSKQIATLGHTSNLYMHPQGLALAQKLVSLTGDRNAKVFFCNSGAEANEAALKLSRKTGRSRIVATQGAFHGRTMGALSMTGQPAKRAPFEPLLKGITHVPFNDLTAMRKVVSRKTAMVIVEPIMGEAGVIAPSPDYLAGVREICDRTGALLVFDCVQTGIGRTGQWFGFEHSGITPDAITLAKGLGAGLPLGALVTFGIASSLFAPGEHGTTFGANPVTCAASLAALQVIEKESLVKNALKQEKVLRSGLSKFDLVTEVRGQGLLLGIGLAKPIATEFAAWLANLGVLVNAPNPTTIRIAPPLNISDVQIKKFISLFGQAVMEFEDVK